MFLEKTFEYVQPNLENQRPKVIDRSDRWCILLYKTGKFYVVDPENNLPITDKNALRVPILLWNARTGEFIRVYGSSQGVNNRYEVTIKRGVFGTSWAKYDFQPQTWIDDIWIVCDPGNYELFRFSNPVSFNCGLGSGYIPVGRRNFKSKIRKWERNPLMPQISPTYTSNNPKWTLVFYDWNNMPIDQSIKHQKALSFDPGASVGVENSRPENRGYYVLKTIPTNTPHEYAEYLEQYEYPLIDPKLDVRVVAFRPHPEIEPGGFNGWYEINRSRERMLEVIDNPSDRFDLSYPSYEAPGVLENVHPVYLPYLIATSIPSYRGWSYKTDALYSLVKRWVYDNEDLNINLPYIYDWWGVQEKWNAYRTDFVFAYNVGNQAVLPVIGNPAWQLQGSLMFGYALWDMMYPRVNDIMTFQPLNKSDQDIPSIFQNPAEKYDQLDPTGQYLDLEIMQKIEGLSLLLDHYHRKVPIPEGKQHLLEKIGLAPPFHIDEHDPAGDRKLDKIFKQVLREYFDQWYKPVTPGTTVKAWLWEEGYHAEWISFVYKPKEFGTKYKAKLYSQNMYVLFNETVGHVRVFSLTQIIPPDPVLDKSVKNYGTNTYILLEDKKAMWHKHTAYILGEYRKLTRVFKQGIYILYDLV